MKKMLLIWMKQWTPFFLIAFLLLVPSGINAQTDADIIFDEAGAAYYIVKKGDTLWDISNKFLNSPWYWPELWKENNQDVPILNPHLIYPGQKIRLYPRDQMGKATPPEMIAEQVFPPLDPPDLPVETPPDGSVFEYALIDRVGFIRKEAVPASGKILEIRGDKEMGSVGDILYIEDAKDDELVLEAEQKYTVYRTSDPIYDKETKSLIGIQHLLLGVVEVSKIEGGYALAKVVQGYRPIHRYDKLMPYLKRSSKIPVKKAPEGISAKFIASEERNHMFGEYDVAFIDKGKNDGIKQGFELAILGQEKGKEEKDDSRTQVVFSPFVIGSLLVFHTEENTSTVLLIRSDQAVHSGTKVGSPVKEE